MLTRTREQEVPQILHIPEKVQKDITDKGFHLYKWITPEEVKLSIERDFLKTLKVVGGPLAIISILFSLPFIGFLPAMIAVFFLIVSLGVGAIFLYLFFLSMRRSRLLTKSAFVVLTDSSISLGGKISKLSEIADFHKDMSEVAVTFEEDLFGESGLEKSKKSLSEAVMDQLFGGYKFIFGAGDNKFGIGQSRDSEKFILVILVLYTLYAGVMGAVYFVGVFFLWIFGSIMTKINTWFLIKKGHTVLRINELFGNIDRESDDIKSEKVRLQGFLEEAYNNEWKEGLLLKINEGIDEVNRSANRVVDDVVELRKTIENSRYKDMFSFATYNGWIKKQVAEPLSNILKLLEKNKELLSQTETEIQEQIDSSTKTEYKSTLELQIKRIHMQKRDIERFIPMLQVALEKLQN